MECLENLGKFCKAVFSLAGSTFDVGSDVLNSLDFMGYNISNTIGHELKGVWRLFTNTTNTAKLVDKIDEMISSIHANNTSTDSGTWIEKLLEAKDQEFGVFDGLREQFCQVDFNQRNISTHGGGYSENELHETWGWIGLGIIFLPGIVLFVFALPLVLTMLIGAYKEKMTAKNIVLGILMLLLTLLACCTFPVTVLIGKFFGLFMLTSPKYDKFVIIASGLEAYFESSFQMVFQFYTIIYGYPVSNIQIISILMSFFLLANAGVSVDTMDMEHDWKKQIKHLLQSIPIYTSCIIFRITSLALTLSFLREYGIISIAVLFVELMITSMTTHGVFKSDGDKCTGMIDAYFLSFSNLGTMNVMPFSVVVLDEKVEELQKQNEKFTIASSIVIFIHHAIVLSTIMALTHYDPAFFEQWTWPNFQLNPVSNSHFYWVFGCTLFCGMNSMILASFRAGHLASEG